MPGSCPKCKDCDGRPPRQSSLSPRPVHGRRAGVNVQYAIAETENDGSSAGGEDKTLMAALSKAVAGAIGKPEQYVMVTVSHSAMLMSGKRGDAAFVEVLSIGGLNGETNRELSQQTCKLLKDSLGVESDRVYLNFTDVEAGNWGWNGSTFG